MQAAPSAPPRRHKPRRVIYKSSALERTAPNLVAAAPAELVSAARSIQNANAAAESVRLSYKQKKDVDVGTAVDGDDDASNAKKYERRLKMNRQSAAASRVRREAYTKALEAELVNMENEYRAAIVKLQAALERNRQLEKAQPAALVDDGIAQDVKQEEEVEVVEEVEEVTSEEFDLADFEDVAAAFPSMATQFPLDTLAPKAEALLADPSFLANPDVLHAPVPDELPDCFLYPPAEDSDLVDKSDFL